MQQSKMVQKITFNRALTDPVFAKEIFRKLPLDAFDTEAERNLSQEINRYFLNNNEPMSEKSLLTHIESRVDDGLDFEKAKDMIDLTDGIYEVETELDKGVAEETLTKHIRRTLSINTLKKFIASGDLEDGEALEKLGRDITEISLMDISHSADDNFLDVLHDTEKKIELYKNLRRKTYPTGFPNVDAMLDGGGMGRGEVSLLIAASGTGKTSMAVQSAVNAMKQGLNVLYVTLEEKLERLSLRMDTNILGTSQQSFYTDMELIDEDFLESIGKVYENQAEFGNLYISKHEPKEISIEKLEQIIVQTKIKKGLDVDYVVIDYPALMRTSYRTETGSEEGGELFERIRGLAQKYDFVCLTLAQTNRSAWGADVVTAENIEGSKKVINACELVLTLNRTQEEYENNFFRFYVDKVRNRRTGITIPNMLSFTVDLEGYQIKSSDADEEAEHMDILRESGREDEVDGFAIANDKVDNINSMLE